ncbi:hypothetical protein Nepgr_007810 [Nepenthes gracilis]|uniref:Uncharacterized protein n=1 Tax=Nepenthes gracilis TaxID=150966 RepID=A0AAD3XIT3_NEPGR|nr:hypothetical protein Nepgr_007810 [Nepenthes gracilis]
MQSAIVSSRWCDELNVVSPVAILVVGCADAVALFPIYFLLSAAVGLWFSMSGTHDLWFHLFAMLSGWLHRVVYEAKMLATLQQSLWIC